MILVDTSVWINFFRGDKKALPLSELLREGTVITHPWIFGELLVGNLGAGRKKILADLEQLPKTEIYPIEALSRWVDHHRCYGNGLSLVDTQILYAAIEENHRLWSHDHRLANAARSFHRPFSPHPRIQTFIWKSPASSH